MTETTNKNTTKKRVTNIVTEILVRCQVTTSKNIPLKSNQQYSKL